MSRRWVRVVPNSRLIRMTTLFAAAGFLIGGLSLIGLLTDWLPLGEAEAPVGGFFAVFGALALRMGILGVYVSDIGVRNRWEFGTRTVRWTDIDHLEIRPSKVAWMRGEPPVLAAWLITRDGRARHTYLWHRQLALDGLTQPVDERHMNILPKQDFMAAYELLNKRLLVARKDSVAEKSH